MQDYTYLQYVLLEKLFPCNMTILGDRAQTIDRKEQDVFTFLPRIFGKRLKKITLDKSYRNTQEIAEYAARYTTCAPKGYLKRCGKAVEEKAFGTLNEALAEAASRAAVRGQEKEEFETAAVLVMTERKRRMPMAV